MLVLEKMVYTVKEMSDILGVGMNKAYDLIHEKRVPFIRVGRKFKIPKKAFENWLNDECKGVIS